MQRNRRGRPQKGSKRRRIYVCDTALINRSIMPDEALAMVQGLPGSLWANAIPRQKRQRSGIRKVDNEL